MIVGTGFPENEGRILAEYVLNHFGDLRGLTISVYDCRAGLLISVFYHSFMRVIKECRPECLDDATKIVWITKYPFQQDNVVRWVGAYRT